MFHRIAPRSSLVPHLGGRAAAPHAPAGGASLALVRRAGDSVSAAPGASLRVRQPKAGFHAGASAVVQPAAILQTWHERASRLESEDCFAYATRFRNQLDRESALRRPPRPALDADAAVRSLLLGDPPGPAGMLQAQEPAVRRAIELLAPKPGQRFVFADPPDLRLCVLLAAHGCDCVVGLSDPEAARQLAQELPRWQNAPPMTGPGPALHARTVARRIQLVDASRVLAGGPAQAALWSGAAQGVVSLLTLQRQRSAAEAEGVLQAQAELLAPGGGLVFDLLHAAGAARLPSGRPPLLLSFEALQALMRDQRLHLAHAVVTARPLAEGLEPIPGRVLARRPGSDAIEPLAADQAAWDLWREAPAGGAGDAVPLEVRVSGLMRKAT